ncbi:MAG: S46 family peptidase [Rikenellaceae bacterium]
MKKNTLLLLLILSSFIARADEGMWIPSIIQYTKLKDMQDKGLKLSAEDLYSVNKASLKDAIVRIDGCTSELISDKGLILTNYHCGYDQVQYHSSVKNDYLTNGFAAMNLKEELPSYRSSADILVRMDDVTKAVTKGVKVGMTPQQERALVKKNIENVVKDAIKGTTYNATVEPLYYNNQYFLFVFESFTDVRLVIAPPSSIGKFGGDTDNWMWPRHTGDFTIFRIYADKNNKPAAYSKSNVPYTPKRSLTISTKPIAEGDFTFIYGFPGVTNEYLHSSAVRQIAEVNNTNKIDLRTIRLDIIGSYMEKDPAVRIQYSAKQANIANAWKRWQGESRGVKKLDAIQQKKDLEASFEKWAADKPEYKNIVKEFTAQYDELEKYTLSRDYYKEAIEGIEVFKFISPFADVTPENINKKIEYYKANKDQFFKDYYKPIDVETAKKMLNEYYENVSSEFHPKSLTENNGRIDSWVNKMFASSMFTSQEKLDKIFSEPTLVVIDAIYADPIFLVYKGFADIYKKDIEPNYVRITNDITDKYKTYMKGLMTMQKDKIFYPDANSTLRIAYGNIRGFRPTDGVIYSHFTTLGGVIDKDNPAIYDYKVDQRLKDLYKNKDFGRWGENGVMPVCFLATNHTTGGNSGSPVLNGNGELIGLNFDRCWESTMSNIVYNDDMCRNIAVDIRYVLFLVDKVCGAGYLIDEMKIQD